MSQRPTTFGQLLRRLTSPPAASTQNHGPFIASATEVASTAAEGISPLWVILHSITDCDVRLIHSRPLAGPELALHIPVTSGEILRVLLTMADSQKNGELYESTAHFLQ